MSAFTANTQDAGRCAGWHGKLPSLGDFASRRLDTQFVDRWDGWLSRGLAALQQEEGWLDGYLQCPAWRFLLLPGVVDHRAWCGVLMPSVDRAGRYYPLTLAADVQRLPDAPGAMAYWTWLAQLEELAYQAVHQECPVDALDDMLLRLGPPPADDESATPAPLSWHSHLQGKSCWCAAPPAGRPRLLFATGLQAGELVRTLFSPT